ncbi:MAG: hypothetical protein JNM01_12420 [Delftia acidovorans]|nr:hypothetical protein [Delftia acidovorans]
MASPAEVVAQQFSMANAYASETRTQADAFLAQLGNSLYTPPALAVSWQAVEAPPAMAPPARPPALDDILGYDIDETVLGDKPAPFTAVPPTVDIDTDFEPAPLIGDAPTLTFGVVPTIPVVADVAVPDMPTVSMPALPTMLGLNTPTFAGVDLHEDFLEQLENVPTLDLVAPTPYSYTPGPKYASALMTALQDSLRARMAGGTGLAPAVEQAIWDRARDRETGTAQAAIDDVMRQSEALGFGFPAGATHAALLQVRRDYHSTLSGLSRDVAIKQAELEQANLKDTVDQALRLEGMLIDEALKLEQISFEASKVYAENAIAIYNAQVGLFQALMQRFQTLASVYRTIIDAELSKVEVFKGLLQAEQTKADLNRALVEQYRAEVEGRMAVVRLYEAQLGGLNTRMQLERTRIEAAAESIRGYVASVNAETQKLEAWKSEASAQVEIYRAKSAAFGTVVSAQGASAQAKLGIFEALVRAKSEEWRGYSARVDAERARMQALAGKAAVVSDVYRADVARYEADAGIAAKRWETQIKQYEAQQNYTISAWKINTDTVNAMNQARLDASKTGAQVYAQMFSSALSRISTQAQVSSDGRTSVSYNYNNKTTSPAPTITVA